MSAEKVPEELIKDVAKETGASEEEVRRIAEKVYGPLTRITPTFIFRALCVWARVRSILIIGPARRIFWSIVAWICRRLGR